MATPQPKPVASMKPVTKKTIVKGTSQAFRVPHSYTWARAGLFYEQKAAMDTWIPLEPAPGKEGYPVSLMVDGDIAISQANEEATCICKFQREFGFSFVGGRHAGKEDVTISVVILKAPEFSFSGQQPGLAKQFPLAKALDGVNGLQFKIQYDAICTHTGPKTRKRYQVPKEMVEHVRVILTRKETLDVKHPILPELPQLQPSAAEKLADWEGRAAMARNEKEEEAAARLKIFEQEAARRMEALRAQLEMFEQNVARARDALNAQLGAEKESLEIELAMEKVVLEVGKEMEECSLLKEYSDV